jgi:signal transduction histidine kinase
MQARAIQIGGTLHLESAPGRGTEVLVRIPLPGLAPSAAPLTPSSPAHG